MKTLRCIGLWVSLLGLLGSSAWAQEAGSSAGQPATHPSHGQLQRRSTPPHSHEERVGDSVRSRIQMPGSTPTPLPVLLFLCAALGAAVFMSLFTAAQYLLNRSAPYGWYAGYLAAMSVWLWQSTRIWVEGADMKAEPTVYLSSKPTVFLATMLILGYAMMVSYIRFISYLLEIPLQRPLLERWTQYFLRFAVLALLVLLVELFVWRSTFVYLAVIALTYGGLLVLAVNILRKKHPLRRYALAGSLFLVGGAVVATLLNATGPKTADRLSQMPLFYLVVSQLLEILCFSLALGRRSYLNNIEKTQAQQQLINQLEENQRLQRDQNAELEHRLQERTTEVLDQAHRLEEHRISQMRSDFDRRAAEAEMAGLRSQMNPHFIFNCLNSIKLYATENESEKAAEYLTKFSRLIRLVLENSRSERVTLQNELDALRLYLEMEAMRFKNKLRFDIHVAPEVDGDFTEIPPLLIQPYVENAIWHGLMHKTEGGTVSVRVELPEPDRLRVTVSDDGVGRAKATELKSKSATPRKSFGMNVTGERIALINQLYQTHTRVQLHDLVDADGHPAGTEVVLEIPI